MSRAYFIPYGLICCEQCGDDESPVRRDEMIGYVCEICDKENDVDNANVRGVPSARQ